MPSRYEEAPSQVVNQVQTVINSSFPAVRNANISVVFDTKKRSSGGKFVLGRMMRPNDLIRFLTESNLKPEGVDYVLFLDKLTYEAISEDDQVRIIRHELQHCDVDPENEKDPFRLRDHEITDFYDEIKYNEKDPRWLERVGLVAASVHEKDKEDEKAAKDGNK